MSKFLDIYDSDELRRVYAEMFPTANFDADCWFIFADVRGRKLLIDGSLSLAEQFGEEASSYPFYSKKAEKRVRAAQARCKWRRRETIPETNEYRAIKSDYPVTIGVTGHDETEH